ncbi:MAG: threonylcarbamoyl-AMP synthase [Verrucomicrobia bacterium GWF2_51_19]|nr:MAG: threonylcarbamoyl-AMP synthase [Verrucomicrobia bacterium GWF2_51_19]
MALILPDTEASMDRVVRSLSEGDVVALPTETVYGLAGSIFQDDAIRTIFSVKGRPLIDPLIVHVGDFDQLDGVAIRDPRLDVLANAFWPGPLTLVMKKRPVVSDLITAGKDTVAVRMPQGLFRQVLQRLQVPLAAPSANPFGYLSPTEAIHVERHLGNRIGLILDGGPCERGIESTILDLTTPMPTVLRLGPVSVEALQAVLGVPVLTKTSECHGAQTAPGMLKKHYSPQTPLTLFDDPSSLPSILTERVAVVLQQRPPSFTPETHTYWLSEQGKLEEVAQNLFALLQKIDRKYTHIFIQQSPPSGLGLAINDRLQRAASKTP